MSRDHVSIRRADLGLLEPRAQRLNDVALMIKVSIRRADLGLLELANYAIDELGVSCSFNPPGGFGAFGTRPTR